MSRSLRLYFEDILIAGEKVMRYTDGMDFTLVPRLRLRRNYAEALPPISAVWWS